MTDIMLKVPRDIAGIVRTALEARAKEFEMSLQHNCYWSEHGTGDVLPSSETRIHWRATAAKLRAIAAGLPRT